MILFIQTQFFDHCCLLQMMWLPWKQTKLVLWLIKSYKPVMFLKMTDLLVILYTKNH